MDVLTLLVESYVPMVFSCNIILASGLLVCYCIIDSIVSECSNGEVRLQDGGLSNEIGRVEVCMAGQWGLVCHNHWDDIDASVVCGQLGYTGEKDCYCA